MITVTEWCVCHLDTFTYRTHSFRTSCIRWVQNFQEEGESHHKASNINILFCQLSKFVQNGVYTSMRAVVPCKK